MSRGVTAADALLHTNVPVIAAVNGAAVGWGMELSMMADIRVASEKAKFGELFVLRGLVTDVCGLGRLTQLVGREKAAELVFTGDIVLLQEDQRPSHLLAAIAAAHRRLTHPDEMGNLFRVMAFTPDGAPLLRSVVP